VLCQECGDSDQEILSMEKEGKLEACRRLRITGAFR